MPSPLSIECSKCKKKLGETNRKKCSNCKLTYYCSVKCQRNNWASHKKKCKKRIELGKDVLFILGHSSSTEEVFRIPKGVKILTYNKCGTPLESGVTMEECLKADRCEKGLKPHIYFGDNDDVMIDMQYNFEPLAKRLIGGKLFIDRDIFLRMGIKMINEDTSIELMEFKDEEYDDYGNIFSKFFIWSAGNKGYKERRDKLIEESIKKMGREKFEEVGERIVAEFDEKEYQSYIKTSDYKRIGGIKQDDIRLFFLSELFLRKMHGTTRKVTPEQREEIYDFFRSRKYKVRLSELLRFIIERSDIKTFSVNGCRSFPTINQERQILSMAPGSQPRRMKSNRAAKPKENVRFRYTDNVFTDKDITPLEPIPLGIYLEKKGEILGMLPERMDNSEVLSMLMSGAVSSRDLGPTGMTKKRKNSTKKGKGRGKPNRKSKRGKPKKS